MTQKRNLGKNKKTSLNKFANSLSELKHKYERKITADGKWILPPDLRAILKTFEGLYYISFNKANRKKPLLIMGETGVGKSVFVDLFENNYKGDHPGVTVTRMNIAAIPDTLIEGELFGHKAGAFTGARKEYHGIIGKLKDDDLLILEEIGELKPYLQVKLLTFIEDGEYYRLHDTDKKTAKNIQIVGTTNKGPQSKNLRKDFFQRFLTFHIPALRDRKTDIGHYAQKLCPEGWALIKNECHTGYLGHLSGDAKALAYLVNPKKPKPLYSDAEWEFLTYSWPGNVRELENVLEMLNVVSRTWSYIPVSNEEKQSLSFLEWVRREYGPQAKLYEAIKNTFATYDPIIIKIALRVLAPDKETKKQFLDLRENEIIRSKRINSKEVLPDLKQILINGPATTKKDLLKTYYMSLIKRTNGNQKQAAKLAGLSESALCSALKIFEITNRNSK